MRGHLVAERQHRPSFLQHESCCRNICNRGYVEDFFCNIVLQFFFLKQRSSCRNIALSLVVRHRHLQQHRSCRNSSPLTTTNNHFRRRRRDPLVSQLRPSAKRGGADLCCDRNITPVANLKNGSAALQNIERWSIEQATVCSNPMDLIRMAATNTAAALARDLHPRPQRRGHPSGNTSWHPWKHIPWWRQEREARGGLLTACSRWISFDLRERRRWGMEDLGGKIYQGVVVRGDKGITMVSRRWLCPRETRRASAG